MIAFRIAFKKRTLYAQCGAFPLPLDLGVTIVQFVDGGLVRAPRCHYEDPAGVIYTDEAEVSHCSVENDRDDANLPRLPSVRSYASERFTVTFSLSPLSDQFS
jgi:hypothetical protein